MSKAKAKVRDEGRFVMPTVRVPANLHRQTKKEAARQGRSYSNYVVALMARSVAKRRRQPAMRTRPALYGPPGSRLQAANA